MTFSLACVAGCRGVAESDCLLQCHALMQILQTATTLWLVRVAGHKGSRKSGNMVPACDVSGPSIEGRVPCNCRFRSLTRMPAAAWRPCVAARRAAGGRLTWAPFPHSASGRSSGVGGQSQAGCLCSDPQLSSCSPPGTSQPGWAPLLRRSSTAAWDGPAPLLVSASLTLWRVGLRLTPARDPSAQATDIVAILADTLASWTQ